MALRPSRSLLLPLCTALGLLGCTKDYDQFNFVADAAASGGSSGSGGTAGSVGGGGGTGGASGSAGAAGAGGFVEGGCMSDLECGTIVGFCKRGLCECGGNMCNLGEACRRRGTSTECACNGGPECNPSETCCADPQGCTSGACN